MIGRRVEHQENLGPGVARQIGGAGFPDVGADVDAAAHALDRHDARRITRLEVALFVEHLVVGQALLVVSRDAHAVADQRGGVVAVAVARDRMPDKERDPGELCGQRVEFALAGLVEIFPEQQVFRRIAAEREFRRQNEVGALRLGALGNVEDTCGVAGEITDGGVYLGDCDLE